MALIKFPIAWFQMSIVFLAPPTNFWCQNVTEIDHGSKQVNIEIYIAVEINCDKFILDRN